MNDDLGTRREVGRGCRADLDTAQRQPPLLLPKRNVSLIDTAVQLGELVHSVDEHAGLRLERKANVFGGSNIG